jgi:predicted Zn-dependent protease
MGYAEMSFGNIERAEAWLDILKDAAANSYYSDKTQLDLLLLQNKVIEAKVYAEKLYKNANAGELPYVTLGYGRVLLMNNEFEQALELIGTLPGTTGMKRDAIVRLKTGLAYTYHQLNQAQLAIDSANEALVQIKKLRELGYDQPWLDELEAANLIILDRDNEALEILEHAYERGLRNRTLFSNLWGIEKLLGDDPRYLAYTQRIDKDVELQKQEINTQLENCEINKSQCALADIGELP